MTLQRKATSTYKPVGDTLTLDGNQQGFMNDGYKNEPNNGAYHQTAKIIDGMIDLTRIPTKQHFLRKVGTGSPLTKTKK